MAGDFLHTHTWNTLPESGFMISCAAEHQTSSRMLSTRIVNPYWAIDYCTTAGGLVRVGSTSAPWVQRKPGIAHLYAPGTSYWEDSRDSLDPRHAAYVCFWGGEIAGLDRFFTNNLRYAQIVDSNEGILLILQQMATVGIQFGHSGLWKAQSFLCRLVYLLDSCEQTNAQTWHIRADNTQVCADNLPFSVQSYLKEHLNEPITLQQIAEHLNVSKSTLSHRYSAQTGETPLATHMALRIENVKHLLRLGTPLKTIAAQMGFCDIYHLSKTFTRATGVSPRGFLQSERIDK